MAEQAAAIVRETVRQSGLAAVVDAQVRFTRADLAGPDALLVQLHVVPRQAGLDDGGLQRRLSQTIRERLSRTFDVRPLVDVTVVEG